MAPTTIKDVDYKLSSYTYDLPEDQIAQKPAEVRDGSRLLVLNRAEESVTLTNFTEIADFLPKNALLIANNSKVIPARIFGQKPTGGRVEFLLLTPLPLLEPKEENGWSFAEAEGLLRASKAPKQGSTVNFANDFRLTCLERSDFGRCKVRLEWQGDLAEILAETGHLPLPPYIHRPDTAEDAERYQTTYAKNEKAGSVAAPTAGLHFTPELRNRLAESGIEWAEVTLYVGYGTFSPVRCEDIRDHQMHHEYIEVPDETVEAIKKAKSKGRPVIAIGTTSARSLEGMVREAGSITPFKGETDIFISPGYEFQVVDGMLTNFHLPESSLVIMVSALAGRETILDAYKQAIDSGFRVFSYGDAMLIV